MKHKKLKLTLLCTAIAMILLATSLTVYAYFSTRVYVYTDSGREVAQVGMNLNLLFDKLSGVAAGTELDIPSYTVTSDGKVQYNENTTYDGSAPWGSAQNPYVISEPRHLQNLSALHSVGYFDLLYVAKNFTNGAYVPGNASIPYFLICTTDGKPVVIAAADNAPSIAPIGSAEHPFVGVIGGAFAGGTATVGSGTTAKTVEVSTIHNFKVQTNTDQTDVGLFGYVGFLGEEPTKNQIDNGTQPQFAGAVSSIQNLLLSDVQIIVKNPTLGETISKLFGPFWNQFFGTDNGHRYSYTDKTPEPGETLPQESHHIGILAGHVSYASIDNISVYYSSETIKALDLTAAKTTDNYYSVSGILGMFYNMNCKVENVTNENCLVKMGTGITADGSGSIVESSGTGGGIYSGNGRGYVTAAEIFTTFNNVDVDFENNELLWRYREVENGAWVENAIMIFGKNTGTDETPKYEYTLADGETDVEINEDGNLVVDGQTWEVPFFVRMNVTRSDGTKEFSDQNYSRDPIYDLEMLGNKYNGEVIWKYSAGGDGIWHYGIRVYEEITQGENGENFIYKLEDGTVVTFGEDITIRSGSGNDVKVWENFFITNVANKTHHTYDRSNGRYLEVTAFERKALPLIDAYGLNQKTGNMEQLCISWQASETSAKLYYFYDGVFTFGLSSPNDTVRDTWKNEQISTLYLGSNNAENWEINAQRGNRAAVALLKAVTSNTELDTAIKAGKQFYITAQPVQGSAYVMSLSAGIKTENENVYPQPIPSTNVLLANADLKAALKQYYADGTYTQVPTVPLLNTNGITEYKTMFKGKNDDGTYDFYDLNDLIANNGAFWDGFDAILDIGRTSGGVTLDQLTNYNNVLPENVKDGENTKYYYYNAQNNIFVGASSDILGVPQYNGFNAYIYYTVSYEAPDKTWYGREYSNRGWGNLMDGSLDSPENASFTKGGQSGTVYDRVRDYTYEFFYQPADGGEPISLGSTKLRVTGVFATSANQITNNSNNLTDTQYRRSYGVVQMPNFAYGMVYYGHSADADTFERQIQIQNFSNLYNGQGQITRTCFEVIDSLSDNVTITAYDSDDNGEEQDRLNNQLLFSLKVGDKTYDGVPMVNATANRFHGGNDVLEHSSDSAIMSDAYVAVGSGASTTYNYYYYDVASGKYYQVTGNNNGNNAKVTELREEATVPTNALLLNRYPAYTFRNNANDTASRSYLQFLHQYLRENYWFGKNGDDFQLWAGTNGEYTQLDNYMAKGHTIESVLVFGQDPDKPNSCYIQYTYVNSARTSEGGRGGQSQTVNYNLTRYVGYTYDAADAANGLTFKLSEKATPLYIYVVEGMLDTSAGVNTFVPKASDTNKVSLNANEVVFWPQTTLTQNGYKQNTLTFDQAKKTYQMTVTSTNDSDLNAKKHVTADPTYQVIPLSSLNWGTATGYLLGEDGKYGLESKFQMEDQGYFGKIDLNADGTFNQLSNSNIMIAPVGSEDKQSAIPKGCVAFAVNAEGTQTIRIVVAVPTTEFYLNEGDFFSSEMDLTNDYYVGIWKMAQIQEGTQTSVTFNKSAAVEKFELPRSYSFSFDDTPMGLEPTTENGEKSGMEHYVKVMYNGQEYRTYLNGDTFLVAYEFTIAGSEANAGTYIIGTTHGSDTDTNNATDVPMEIVHFSVSGTASAGRDGVEGSQIGAIDFVYDADITTTTENGQGGSTVKTIIDISRKNYTNIEDSFEAPTNSSGENYANFYASRCLLYTDNAMKLGDGKFISIDQVAIGIRRSLVADGTSGYKTRLTYAVSDDDDAAAVKVVAYGENNISDEIVKSATTLTQ